jgi:hypothetical protein
LSDEEIYARRPMNVGPAETTAPPPAATADGELFDDDAEVVGYERSPIDVLRLVVFVAAAAATATATKYLRDGFDGVEEELTELIDASWGWVRLSIDVLLIVTVLVATVVVLLVPLITRRLRLFGYVLAASVTTSLVMAGISAWVGGFDSPSPTADPSTDELARSISADVVGTAQMIATFVVISPFVSRRWRRTGAWMVTAILVLRLVVTTSASTHALLVITVGSAVGTAVLLAFGRPATQAKPSAILAALNASGLTAVSIGRSRVDARGSVPYVATLEDGGRVFTKVLGADQRAADLLFRLYRSIRL